MTKFIVVDGYRINISLIAEYSKFDTDKTILHGNGSGTSLNITVDDLDKLIDFALNGTTEAVVSWQDYVEYQDLMEMRAKERRKPVITHRY